MRQQPDQPRRWARYLFTLTAFGLAAVVPATPAFASDYTITNVGTYTSPPNFYFYGNSGQTDNSELDLYMTDVTSGIRYRIAARAGSGDGSTNECYTNHGWLPDGTYGRADNDPNSTVEHMYKTWGNTTVRGNVWSLGSKVCDNGTPRTELFIHSNGIEGTPWNNNWKTEGCIKVSQAARDAYMGYWWIAYDGENEQLTVSH
jgi:hypothetical protein